MHLSWYLCRTICSLVRRGPIGAKVNCSYCHKFLEDNTYTYVLAFAMNDTNIHLIFDLRQINIGWLWRWDGFPTVCRYSLPPKSRLEFTVAEPDGLYSYAHKIKIKIVRCPRRAEFIRSWFWLCLCNCQLSESKISDRAVRGTRYRSWPTFREG